MFREWCAWPRARAACALLAVAALLARAAALPAPPPGALRCPEAAGSRCIYVGGSPNENQYQVEGKYKEDLAKLAALLSNNYLFSDKNCFMKCYLYFRSVQRYSTRVGPKVKFVFSDEYYKPFSAYPFVIILQYK